MEESRREESREVEESRREESREVEESRREESREVEESRREERERADWRKEGHYCSPSLLKPTETYIQVIEGPSCTLKVSDGILYILTHTQTQNTEPVMETDVDE